MSWCSDKRVSAVCRPVAVCVSHHFLRDHPEVCDPTHDWVYPTKQLTTSVDGGPGEGHALPIIFQRYWANKVVHLVGDSVSMEEHSNAIACELRAHGMRPVPITQNDFGGVGPAGAAVIAAYFAKVTAINHSEWWNGSPPEAGWWVEQTSTLLMRKGWGKFVRSDALAQMAVADVLVVGYALHYLPEEGFLVDFSKTKYAPYPLGDLCGATTPICTG